MLPVTFEASEYAIIEGTKVFEQLLTEWLRHHLVFSRTE
jgi:hypothetical protein